MRLNGADVSALRSPGLRGVRAWIIPLLTFAVFVAHLAPFSIDFRLEGLDPSWQAVAAAAARLDLVFGRDIVFTVGPLSPLFTHQYAPGLVTLVMAIGVLAAAWYAYVAHRLAGPGRGALALAAAGLFVAPSPDAILLAAPVAFGIAYAQGARKAVDWAPALLVAGAFSMTKFSVFPLALLIAILSDGLRLIERKPPVLTLFFVAACALFFALAGQPLGAFVEHLGASLDVASGYSSAMALDGPIVEFAVWCALAAALLGLSAKRALDARAQGAALHRYAASAAVIALAIWIAAKAGFVRHDQHALVAWAALGWVAVFHAANARGGYSRPALAVAVASLIVGAVFSVMRPGIETPLAANLKRIAGEFANGGTFVINPQAWLSRAALTHERALQHASLGAPALQGSVDMVPSTQSRLLGSGARFTPRPTIQEYTTYTSRLIEMSRAHFSDADRPAFVLFAPGSIDDRHPASAEGGSWPVLFANYAPAARHRELLILKSRATPATSRLGPPVETEIGIGAETAMPAGSQFASFDIRPTIAGRLADLLFKPPRVMIELAYADRPTERYRLVPRMAAEGMILSPTIYSVDEFALLASGETQDPYLHSPTTLRIIVDGPAGIFYRRKVGIAWRQVLSGDAVAFDRDTARDAIARLDALYAANALEPGKATRSGVGLIVRAPSSLVLPIEGAESVALSFRSFSAGTDRGGALCFAASVAAAGVEVSTPLLERCLAGGDDAKAAVRFNAPANAKTLRLRTYCRGACPGWGVWEEARPTRRD